MLAVAVAQPHAPKLQLGYSSCMYICYSTGFGDVCVLTVDALGVRWCCDAAKHAAEKGRITSSQSAATALIFNSLSFTSLLHAFS